MRGVEIIPGRGKGQANLGTWGLPIMLHFLCGAARGAGLAAVMFSQQMEEVALAEAELLDPLSPGGWGRVVEEEGGQPTTLIPQPKRRARQTLWRAECFVAGGRGWGAEIVSLPAAGSGEGTRARKEPWKDGGGRLLLSLVAD